VSAPSTGAIAEGAHRLAVRVYYEDTDAAGIVYYANWLRFLERGRTELLRSLGHDHAGLRAASGLNWVVRRCAIEYLKPARLDEWVEIITRIGEVRGASLDMLQEAQRGPDTLVRAELAIACVDVAGRPVRLPAEARAAMSRVASTPRSRHIPL